MKKIVLFGGTTEEHALIQALIPYTAVTVCVTGDYATELLKPYGEQISVHVGRMDQQEMERYFLQEGFSAAIDATHPYAVLVTENLRAVTTKLAIPYYRLHRKESDLTGCHVVSSAREAALFLQMTQGNILLTTGSKELSCFTSIPDFPQRIYPRVLPCVDSLHSCLALGYLSSHIIAMQGPFSRALNMALLEQFSIAHLVTKESGAQGGFSEKIEAAHSLGIAPIVIARSSDTGNTLEEILSSLLSQTPHLPSGS